MQASRPALTVIRVLPYAVIDLRHRILRDGLPREEAIFDGDDELTTIHLAAIDEVEEVVGVTTILHRPWEGAAAWQLRGMAVDAARQSQGVGGALLREVDRIVAASEHSRQLWCNARLIAKRFYERHGWTAVGEQFDIPTAGPHYKMTKKTTKPVDD